jgi:hypothetical protein
VKQLTIVVPSEQYLSLAGTRIRYQRIAAPLARNGWAIRLLPVDQVGEIRNIKDPPVYLFSKVQDARAIAMATEVREAGGAVGIDLFDDYFSQRGDSRLAPQRNWLQAMTASIDFFLCSTPRMQAVAASYADGIPSHILNDPFGQLDMAELAANLARKSEDAMRTDYLPVVWFGTGDNPNFPVGLHDLSAWCDVLARLARGRFKVGLTILTNLRALDAKGLSSLRRMPVPFKIEEWSEARECEALATSFVSFIPVNAQPFSIAKSLNRGVSALTGGTQLLSVGFPLYAPLGGFIYRNPAALLADIDTGNLRHSSKRLSSFAACLDGLANPDIEAARFATFLDSIRSSRTGPAQRPVGNMAILHGGKTSAGIHNFAQQRGWLSLGSPFTPAGMTFDAHLGFFSAGQTPSIRISKRAKELLPKEIRGLATRAPTDGGKGPPFELPLASFETVAKSHDLIALAKHSLGDRIALYPFVMAETRRLYTALFGHLRFIPSELDALLNVAASIAEPIIAEPKPT